LLLPDGQAPFFDGTMVWASAAIGSATSAAAIQAKWERFMQYLLSAGSDLRKIATQICLEKI
jgi:hypothetical protein